VQNGRQNPAGKRGFALATAFAVLVLLVGLWTLRIAFVAADYSLALSRMRLAVARADARVAAGQALCALSQWPGLDRCATATGGAAGAGATGWTLCERPDGTRVWLVSTLPTSSSAEAPLEICDGVRTPVLTFGGADGARASWWVEDLGSSQSAFFTLTNSLDGGLREDLGHLEDGAVEDFARPPAEGVAEWMRLAAPLGEALAPRNDASRIEPVVTEVALVMGLGANSDQYKPYQTTSVVDIVLAYHMFVEVWNPFTRPLALGAASPDVRVRISGLPRPTASNGATISIPDPFEIELDCFDDLGAGKVQLLSSPASGGGANNLGAWQMVVGTIRLNKLTYHKAVTLSFPASSPVVEFFDVADDAKPFFTLNLGTLSAFTLTFGTGNYFERSATATGANGMGRDAMNAGGWAYALHARMDDSDLASLFREHDPRASTGAAGDGVWLALAKPSDYERDDVIRADDFFATLYSGPPYSDRQALFCDPPAGRTLSMLSLRHAPQEGRAAFAMGAGRDAEADAMPDRYFFSGLPAGEWTGTAALPDPRIVLADESTPVRRTADDAEGLLFRGGLNVNTADAEAWAALLSSLAVPDWEIDPPSGAAVAHPLAAALFPMPWSASQPPDSATVTAIRDGVATAFAVSESELIAQRRHPAFLAGVRDLGEHADALAKEIATRIAARGRPFQSLSELAQSGIFQDAIDAVPALNARSGGADGVPEGSPANIDQSLLLCALSPVLFTRSDTFRIVAYGREGQRGTAARAELFVQRLPTQAGEGRSLRVCAFRWLGAEVEGP
jgi:hypothetical protein